MLAPALAGLSESRQQLLLFSLTLLHRFRGDGLDAANDGDVVSASGALASTYETAARGLIYEQRADSAPARRMTDKIREVFDELGRGRPSGFAADAGEVLRRIEERARAVRTLAADNPRAFLELAGRFARRLGEPGGGLGQDGDRGAEPEAGPSIILP